MNKNTTLIEIILISLGFILMVLLMNIDSIVDGVMKGDKKMNVKLPDPWFDILKWCAIVALPAISSFIVVISRIWGWADLGNMIAQTVTAVATLLGALLCISHIQYKNENEE